MAKNPIRHVAAEAGSQSALAVLIDERIRALGIVEALHQVFERSATPLAVNRIDEFLAIPRRSVEIDHDDHVAIGREEFGIPTIAPVISPSSLWSPVNQEFDRVFFLGIEVRRLDKEAFHFFIARAREPESFERSHGDARENRMIEIGQLDLTLFHVRSLASLGLNFPA